MCLPILTPPPQLSSGLPFIPNNTALEQMCADLERKHCYPIPCPYFTARTPSFQKLRLSQVNSRHGIQTEMCIETLRKVHYFEFWYPP